jgi:hypothetical protein
MVLRTNSITAENDQESSMKKPKKKEETVSITQLTEDQIKMLEDILDWWRKRKEGLIELREIRPNFKRGPTVTRSVRIGKSLSEEAEKKAKREKFKTGGTLNGLIELLLWEYLGRDKKFVD